MSLGLTSPASLTHPGCQAPLLPTRRCAPIEPYSVLPVIAGRAFTAHRWRAAHPELPGSKQGPQRFLETPDFPCFPWEELAQSRPWPDPEAHTCPHSSHEGCPGQSRGCHNRGYLPRGSNREHQVIPTTSYCKHFCIFKTRLIVIEPCGHGAVTSPESWWHSPGGLRELPWPFQKGAQGVV